MNQKFVLFVLVILLAQVNSFAQQYDPAGKAHETLPIVVEQGISGITVSDNIDLVLIQDYPENVKVKAPDNVMGKIKVSYTEGRLFIEAAKNSKADERLVVYAWVNNLESLTLKGNSVVVSRGILQSRDLHVSIADGATVSLKSKSKVWFDAPSNYQVVKQDGYFMLSSLYFQ